MEREVNLGVIGLGRIGKLHVQNIMAQVTGVKLMGISDVLEEALQDTARKFSVSLAKQDYRYLLDNKQLDAVVICTSTDTHAKIISEAAQAGKHIFCEKPIALDLADIDKALSEVKKSGVKLQIGFNR